MATATIAQVMQAIETVLDAIDGLKASDTSPGQVNPPQAVVGVPAISDYQTSYGSSRPRLEPTVTIYTSTAVDRAGQIALAGYADPDSTTSVIKAINADPTLGGVVNHCQVTSFRPLGLDEVGALGYTAGEFILRVLT